MVRSRSTSLQSWPRRSSWRSGESCSVGAARVAALVALGMLLYTVIQSPGYFLARHELAPVVMFAVLALLTVAAIVVTATL